MQTVYLICGVAGSGKSWACNQVSHLYSYVPHDECWHDPKTNQTGLAVGDNEWRKGAKNIHKYAVLSRARISAVPVITECPFNERELRWWLVDQGVAVRPVFCIESPSIIAERYLDREGVPPPASTITHATSIIHRAKEWKAFSGPSAAVAQYLFDEYVKWST